MKSRSLRKRADAAMAAAILVVGGCLLGAGQRLIDRWGHLTERRQSFALEDVLGAMATCTGLAVIIWWALSFAAAVIAVLLEQSGKSRQAAGAANFSPLFMRRLAVAVLGLNLVGIPMANAATTPGSPAWHATSGTSTSASALPGVVEPVRAPIPQVTPGSPHWMMSQHEAKDTTVPHMPEARWRPHAPLSPPGLLVSRSQRQQAIPSGTAAEVVVRAGESLWTIAAKDLGPLATDVEIALHWPRWYYANRDVIGDDPDVLLPGQVLRPPADIQPVTAPLS